MAISTRDATLAGDAEGFSREIEALARIYQLQDPRQTCSYGITLTECYGLEAIVLQGSLSINGLAAALALDKSTASRAAAGLVRKGLARRRNHPGDGRAVEIRATPAGTRLFERIRAGGRRSHLELISEFPPEVRRAVTTLLSRIVSIERACATTGCAPCN